MKFYLQLLIVVLIFGGIKSVSAEDAKLSVKVRSTAVRNAPKSWAPAVSTVKYGDLVSRISQDKGWIKVKSSSGATGYIHESAVTSKKVVLAARSQGVSSFTDSNEIVLAGKGFNSKVEKQLAQTDTSLNFSAVNFMEQQKISTTEIANFIRSGKLNQNG